MKTSLKDYIIMALDNASSDGFIGCSRETILNHFSIKKPIFRSLSAFSEQEVNKIIDELIEEGKIVQGPAYGWNNWLVVINKLPEIAEALRIKNAKNLERLLK